MVVLVTGGREYDNPDFVWWMLDRVHARRRITKLVEGGARGADAYARAWAISRGIEPTTEDADWTRYGHRAGTVRNRQMHDEHRPHLVVAFPGGTGTANMISIAMAAGTAVLRAWRHEKEYENEIQKT